MKENIENIIAQLMIDFGPDGHCDGSDIIAHYVCALLEGTISPDSDVKAVYSELNLKGSPNGK